MNTNEFLMQLEKMERGKQPDSMKDEDILADLRVANLLFCERSAPTPAFHNKLHNKLLQNLQQQESNIMSKPVFSFFSVFLKRKTAFAVLMISLVVMFSVAMSPVARAAAKDWFSFTIKEVDDLFTTMQIRPVPSNIITDQPENANFSVAVVEIKKTSKDDSILGSEDTEDQSNVNVLASVEEGLTQPNEKTITYQPEVLSLEEAQRLAKFPILLPSYIPDGYFLENVTLPSKVTDAEQKESKHINFQMVSLAYKNQDGKRISISQQPAIERSGEEEIEIQIEMLVGKGSVKEISVNNQPAKYIQGTWNIDGTWNADASTCTLLWEGKDGTHYEINAENLPIEEMTHIAESLQ